MKTVAFNYDLDAKADFYIQDFSELASLPDFKLEKLHLSKFYKGM